MRLTSDNCIFRVQQVIRPILVLAANGSWVGEEDVGGTSLVFAIKPCLPPGLWLDSVSGMIFGKPQQTVAHGTIFTLTASNALGSTSIQLTMGVLDQPTPMWYTHRCAVYGLGLGKIFRNHQAMKVP
jgi:hypothetical protein